ncbi:MAG: flagellar filament capping protein FliD [Myxococcota bacterium]
MSITIDGVFSGFDTTALIEAILTGSRQRIILREGQVSDNQITSDRLSEMSGLLSSLSSRIETLQGTSGGIESQAFTTSFAEGFGFTAEAGDGAVLGTYDIDIASLATAQIESSNETYAERSTTGVMGQGTIAIDIGGTVTDVTIDSTNDSLTGFADAINAVSGVSAYVLDTGDATNPYQLIVQAERTGASNAFTIDTSGLSGGSVPTFSNVQAGADAALTVNGIAVTSDSNTIQAVPGLTINATQAGLGNSVVTVGFDSAAFKQQVEDLLSDYNEIITFYDANTAFDTDANTQGPLNGESVARNIVDRIGTLISGNYTSVLGSFSLLAQIGVQTQQDGTLLLDSPTFDAAVENNFDDVVEVLTSADGPLSALKAQIDDVYINSDGLLDSRRDTLQDEIVRLQEDIEREEERIESRTDTLRAQFTRLEESLAELQSSGNSLSALLSTAPSGGAGI